MEKKKRELSLKDVSKTLRNHEARLLQLEGNNAKTKAKGANWYKPGSTIDKIVTLINHGYFKKPRTISEIQTRLKEQDYHFKSSDLTLPLRKIVRNELLKKTKYYLDGTPSKKWLYVAPHK